MDPIAWGIEKYAGSKEFLAKLFGKPAAEIGNALADEIRIRRFARSLKLFEDTEKLLSEKGYNPKKVSPRFLLPLIDKATLEEDESMHARWAALLANAASPKAKYEPRPDFVAALSEMSPEEAAILDYLYDLGASTQIEPNKSYGILIEQIPASIQLSRLDKEVALDNLIRLRLCCPADGDFHNLVTGPTEGIMIGTYPNSICITAYGQAFVMCCRWAE